MNLSEYAYQWLAPESRIELNPFDTLLAQWETKYNKLTQKTTTAKGNSRRATVHFAPPSSAVNVRRRSYSAAPTSNPGSTDNMIVASPTTSVSLSSKIEPNAPSGPLANIQITDLRVTVQKLFVKHYEHMNRTIDEKLTRWKFKFQDKLDNSIEDVRHNMKLNRQELQGAHEKKLCKIMIILLSPCTYSRSGH